MVRPLSELTTSRQLLERDLKDPEFRAEWERLAAARALAEMVSDRRVAMKLTQTQLAKLVGVSQPVIARIESGDHSPTIETLDKLANALDIEIVLGITPSTRTKSVINVPAKHAKSVTEAITGKGSRLVISAA